MEAKRQAEWNQYHGAEQEKEARKGISHAKLKHSAIREYSDHLITFQSMFSRVSHQPLKQKKVQSETEPLRRLAQVYDIDVPDGAGGSDPQHWPGTAPRPNVRLLPRRAPSHVL